MDTEFQRLRREVYQALAAICLVLLVIEVKSGFLSGGPVGLVVILFTCAICARVSYLYMGADSRGECSQEPVIDDLDRIESSK